METPITQIGIVADKTKPPFLHTVIEKSCDGMDDADLWKDGFLRRSYRYICYSKDQNSPNVLVGLQLINEREDVPTGFASLDLTMDSNEKAMKKKILCVKFVPKIIAKTAITDITIFSRTKRMPPGYTLVSELNSLLIAYKAVPINTNNSPVNTTSTMDNNLNFVPKGDDYSKATIGRIVTPLSGVPFNLSKKFSQSSNNQSFNPYTTNIEFKTASQIYNQYNYNFAVENSVLRDQ